MMSDLMTLMMAVFFLWVGVRGINRPEKIQDLLSTFWKTSARGNEESPMLQIINSGGTRVFIRLMGFLCLVNFAMLVYLLTLQAPQTPI